MAQTILIADDGRARRGLLREPLPKPPRRTGLLDRVRRLPAEAG